MDEHDTDDLDDDDVAEDVPEQFGDDLDIETKEKEIDQVTFWCGKLVGSVVKFWHVL